MTSNITLENQIAGAWSYEHLHVAALFSQWPPKLLAAAGAGVGDRLLDVACGTGILARVAAIRVGAAGFVAGLDPSRGMLMVAREIVPEVSWTEGAAESLPFADGCFDIVACQFGLMFFADRPRALREMLRVLRPRGRLVAAVWAGLECSEAFASEVALLERLAGTAAADALRAPFLLGSRDAFAAMLREAGFESVAVDTVGGIARYPGIRTMVEAELRGWLPVMGVVMPESLIAEILAAAEGCLSRFVEVDGQVVFGAPAHIATAVAPAG